MSDEFERAWKHLEAAVEWTRHHTKESVLDTVLKNRSQLWILPHSAAITMISKFPSGRKSMHIWLAGGDLDEIVEWTNGAARQSAISAGCDEMRFNGRRGWVRVLKQDWRDVGSMAVRDLDHA